MAVNVRELITGKYAENALTLQYTATNCYASIDKFTATNVSVANATLTVYLVPKGGTATNANVVTITRAIAPNETYTFPGVVGHNLAPGGSIYTTASAASAISIRASGRETT